MSKEKGIRGEREVLHQFWKTGEWVALRVPASGSMPYPCPDVLAGNHSRTLAIECKVTKNSSQYFSHREIKDLQTFSRLFGAEPWVGVRFDRVGWRFFCVEDLKITPRGYGISFSMAKLKAVVFDELVAER